MSKGILYPYQLEYLRDQAKFKAAMFARQTGKTFTTTLEIVNDVLDGMAKGKPTRWTIMSISKARALDAMDNGVKLHLQAYGLAFEAVQEEFDKDELSFEVRFPDGSRIRAIAANATTARGMTENLFLDEFAFHKDSRAIWTALLPVVSRPELKLRIASTPNGKNNKFYEIMTDEDDNLFSRHVTNIYQAVADGLPRDIDMLRKAMKDPVAWAQEFECGFIDEGSAWLTFDIINACEVSNAGNPSLYAGGPCAVGMDIARRGDFTIITVIENIFGLWIVREIIELKNKKFSVQMAELARVMRQYKVFRAALDQTGMGEKFVEDAKELFGDRVEGVLFTGPNKLNMATALKEAMEDRKLLIPISVDLRGDLHSVKRVAGSTGAPRLVADRSEAEGSHADRFWSLALAVSGTDGEVVDFSQCASAGTNTTAALDNFSISKQTGWGTVRKVSNGY